MVILQQQMTMMTFLPHSKSSGLCQPQSALLSYFKGVSQVEQVGQSHMAAENIGEQQRMLGMKFYVTET